ncbi:hypothetical protein RCG23_05250 [Neobacillus sp. PS3-34]|uniref:hypothetical protein n=1 Tax=Neobacillus sp. PS3-34 TaxID=3070678 RepID=UPI0027DF2CE2|nr:hypothetical protein [Neobacillus sp. PS3-34]WML49425.1 hypothetical protein RCG23_05250 [Neobacillus sp. PS3-34]
MNHYYMQPGYYRNQPDTRFFPFLPFVAGLATGGLLAVPFIYGNTPFIHLHTLRSQPIHLFTPHTGCMEGCMEECPVLDCHMHLWLHNSMSYNVQ